ncbi:MAG: DUF1638 domain-containing protein [Planctomycetes bacterium]|nr:DUF1638 domain-containing protein [Planctomycetota bacterium]
MRLKLIACKVVQREAYYCASRSGNIVDVVLMEQGLHNEPDKLRDMLQKALEDTTDVQGNRYDAVVLGYCLCSNGILGLKCDVPMVAVRGHDCMTLLLGSKDKYQEYFDTHRGVYWYSCGWIDCTPMPGKERCEKLLAEYTEKYGDDNAQYLMEMEQGWMKEYEWATFVSLGLCDEKKYKDHTKECAKYLGWEYDEIEGDMSLLQGLVDGNWDEEEYLVVKPGKTFAEDLTNKGIIKEE